MRLRLRIMLIMRHPPLMIMRPLLSLKHEQILFSYQSTSKSARYPPKMCFHYVITAPLPIYFTKKQCETTVGGEQRGIMYLSHKLGQFNHNHCHAWGQG